MALGAQNPSSLCYHALTKLLHYVGTAYIAHRMKETTLHLCNRHKGFHILGGWWLWQSAISCCVNMLEDDGSLQGTYAFHLDGIGTQLAAICSTMWAVTNKPCY